MTSMLVGKQKNTGQACAGIDTFRMNKIMSYYLSMQQNQAVLMNFSTTCLFIGYTHIVFYLGTLSR